MRTQKQIHAHLIWLAIFATVVLSGCTAGQMAQFTSLGSPGHIRCYSGTQLIYEGTSTGKISTESGSDGWFFEDAKTKKLIRVSGACVIEN
ncbi:MAG: hypothetical protein NVS1B5_14580 [Gemmatimonadaceae bacterium]